MEQYFIVNSVPEEKQVAAFFTAIGGLTYKLLQNLILPVASMEKSLTELETILCSHLKLKPLIAEHFKFHKCTVGR